MKPVDAAVAMAQLGYHVVPVVVRLHPLTGKKTLTGQPTGWQAGGLTVHPSSEATDVARIRAEFDALGAQAYIIPLGPSGVTVVDLDVKGDGAANWSAAGGTEHAAFEVATWSGGRHLYFASAGSHNTTGRPLGVDVRGIGGCVVGPGSVVLAADGSVAGRYTADPQRGSAVRSLLTPEPTNLRAITGAATGSLLADGPGTSFWSSPPMTYAAALALANRKVIELRQMPNAPGSGMRAAIMGAALTVGGLVHAGAFTFEEAEKALLDACDQVYGQHDDEDALWVAQGLHDGVYKKPLDVLPGPKYGLIGGGGLDVRDVGSPAVPADQASPDVAVMDPPRGLPTIPDSVWEHYAWTRTIRNDARVRGVAPDAVLGSWLAWWAAQQMPALRLDTGWKTPLGANLVVSLVGPSGSGKSAAFRTVTGIAGGGYAEIVNDPSSGEAFCAQFVQPDPDSTEPLGKRPRVLKQNPRVLFYVGEGGQLNAASQRAGSAYLPKLRSLAVDEALSTTNATAEINRRVDDMSYSAGVVVGFQPSTAMQVIRDTSTGTAQRFWWFSAVLTAEDYEVGDQLAAVAHPRITDAPMPTFNITRLTRGAALNGSEVYTLPFAASITATIKAESRAFDLGRDIEDVEHDRDSHRHMLVAKAAALACLADDRVLVTWDDWEWASALYEASCAVRDDLLRRAEAREAQEAQERSEAAARSRAVVQAWPALVHATAERIVRVLSERGELSARTVKRNLSRAQQGAFTDAVDQLSSQGWLRAEPAARGGAQLSITEGARKELGAG